MYILSVYTYFIIVTLSKRPWALGRKFAVSLPLPITWNENFSTALYHVKFVWFPISGRCVARFAVTEPIALLIWLDSGCGLVYLFSRLGFSIPYALVNFHRRLHPPVTCCPLTTLSAFFLLDMLFLKLASIYIFFFKCEMRGSTPSPKCSPSRVVDVVLLLTGM